MATLNTLRTKYGIVLSIVIAVVLLAFILGDQLSYRGGDQQVEDATVATINGKAVKQSEYHKVREAYDSFQQFSSDVVADQSMQSVIYDSYLAPAFKQVGINVVQGEIDNYARMFGAETAEQYRNYGWPEEQISALVQNSWMAERLSAERTIAAQKFTDHYAAGFYANKADVEDQLRKENLTFDGRYVAVPYSTVADEEVVVTDEEVKAYAEAHRVDNPRYGSRVLRYVTFDIEPSAEDAEQIDNSVNTLHATVLAASDAEAIKSAVRSAGGKVGGYKNVETLGDEKSALVAGTHYGPVKGEDNVWKAFYYLDGVKAPVSFDFSIAEAESMPKAEAIVAELVANNGDSAKLSEPIEFTEGSVELAQLTENQAKNFIGRKEGDIFAFMNNGVPSVVKINALGDVADFVLTADVEKAVVASEKTIREITSKVDAFEAEMGATVESFQQAADNSSYLPKSVTVSRNDYRPNPYYQVQRMAGNIPNSRSMAVWAYGAGVGEAKRFNIDGTIYVAMVVSVDNEKYTLNESAARRALLRDKKYAKLAETLTMDAETTAFSGVKFEDQTIGDVRDAHLITAIASSRNENVPTKVKGTDAAYIFVVEKINGVEELPAVEQERIPINTQLAQSAQNVAMNVLVGKAEIEDMRGETSL